MKLMRWIMAPLATIVALLLGITGFGLTSAAASQDGRGVVAGLDELPASNHDDDPVGLLRILDFLINLDGSDEDGDDEDRDRDKGKDDGDKVEKDDDKDKGKDDKAKRDNAKRDREKGDDDNGDDGDDRRTGAL